MCWDRSDYIWSRCIVFILQWRDADGLGRPLRDCQFIEKPRARPTWRGCSIWRILCYIGALEYWSVCSGRPLQIINIDHISTQCTALFTTLNIINHKSSCPKQSKQSISHTPQASTTAQQPSPAEKCCTSPGSQGASPPATFQTTTSPKSTCACSTCES